MQEDTFIVQFPKGMVKAGIGMSIIAGVICLVLLIYGEEGTRWWMHVTFIFLYIVWVRLTLEFAKKKIIIEEDIFTVHYWTGKTKTMKIDEISKIRTGIIGFKVYGEEKKIFELTGLEENVNLFRNKLNDKMVDLQIKRKFKELREESVNLQQELFTMRLPNILAVIAAMAMFLGIGNMIVIYCFFSLEDGLGFIFLMSFMAIATLLFLCILIRCLVWRVRVSSTTLTIRSVLNGEKVYLIDDITYVRIRNRNVEAYVGEKRIVKFSYLMEHGQTLLSILKSSSIDLE